jgi:DNA-binding CsgD family transcriptional regulator
MAESFEELLPLLSRIWASEDLDEVFRCVDEYGKSQGFQYTVLSCFGRMLTPAGAPAPVIDNERAALTKVYRGKNYFEIDPLVKMAKRTNVPFTSKEAFIGADPVELAFKAELERLGVVDRLAVPVHLNGQPSGAIAFHAGKHIDLSRLQSLNLMMVCHAAYYRAVEFFKAEIKPFELRLSAREHEILTLVARGKTNWEIGTVLSLSEFSVRDYLKGLSKKLETSNRAHTAARALQLGLILP